jgi:hypothetical protein
LNSKERNRRYGVDRFVCLKENGKQQLSWRRFKAKIAFLKLSWYVNWL